MVASQTIDVLPAPNPTIEIPDLPGSLTCDEAANFVAPDASFSNGASDEVCLIDGTTPGVVANDFDQCGGEIMITWTLSTGCDNGAVTETLVIPVLPAPDPEIMLPELPTELTCDEAAGFVAPDASFSNGIDGTCLIEGTVAGVIEDDFTICGGTITITYIVDPSDNCEREGVTAEFVIDVLPAPAPEITIPELPESLTCEEAAAFMAPDASFSNGPIDEVCLIEGTTPGVVMNDFTECGGEITITWTTGTGCDNNSIVETATIEVTPAAEPIIELPTVPGSLTCDELSLIHI